MIDIVKFKGDKFDLGYKQVFYYKEFNIVDTNKDEEIKRAASNPRIDILLNVEKFRGRDHLHFRNSGLIHGVCMMLKKNNIAFGFSFNEILFSKNRIDLLGKMMQNVRLCKKYKIKMVFSSFAKNKYEMRSSRDMMAFARLLGMSSNEAKEALNFKKKEPKIKLVE